MRIQFIRILPATEWGFILLGIGLLTLTEQYQTYILFGLALLVAANLLRWLRTGRLARRSGLEWPIVLFLGSAAVAVAISYEPATSFLQLTRMLAAVTLFYSITESNEQQQTWLAAGFVLAAAVLAVYWPLQHDFSAEPGKLGMITQIGGWLNRSLPTPPGPSIHGNVAAGTLALAVPFGVGLIWQWARRRRRSLAGLAGALTALILLGLFMTSSRGGWLAVLGVGGVALLAAAQRRYFQRPAQAAGYWGGVVILAAAVGMGVLLTGNLDRLVGMVPDPTGGWQSRLALWSQGWSLVRDYPFTGSGLMMHWNVQSTYALLIHTPIIAHAHNSFLEVWIEQGVVGAVALAWGSLICLTWALRSLKLSAGNEQSSVTGTMLGWSGLAAVLVACVHGLVDVVFYVERTLPLLGLALGFAWLVEKPSADSGQRARHSRWGIEALLVSITALLVVLAALAIPRLRAAWQANLGTLQQTRLELAAYDPARFDTYSLDQVRQALDLNGAMAQFERALDTDPTQRSALQRLAEIALSRGEYARALELTTRLWQAGYRDEVTRLVHSDALVADGQIRPAAEIAQGLPWAVTRLLGQAWYRYWVGKDYLRAADAWATVLLIEPDNATAQSWERQARAKVK